ncbi:hypothetical protein VA7868_04542 [Vibrio aerogenes CECT 7868]|uniref:Uncharacterized protein n=1 Tax=Vibrio aerogenes CECT 7868 TaxID=1216006 RepID=A0A1M6EY16_9VIBR|nr:hypothetical protein VA7868_04542 [Vibrio aerogenes CECT 7868]
MGGELNKVETTARNTRPTRRLPHPAHHNSGALKQHIEKPTHVGIYVHCENGVSNPTLFFAVPG